MKKLWVINFVTELILAFVVTLIIVKRQKRHYATVRRVKWA
jgi:hypothetical protein